jgi:hypothetical protein
MNKSEFTIYSTALIMHIAEGRSGLNMLSKGNGHHLKKTIKSNYRYYISAKMKPKSLEICGGSKLHALKVFCHSTIKELITKEINLFLSKLLFRNMLI